MTAKPKDGLRFLGLVGVACLACCAGPVLGVIGGIGLAGLLSARVIGGLGFLIAAVAAVAFITVRRRSTQCSAHVPDIPIEFSVHRPVTATREATKP